jgi:(p)ppGpp synthase/HD superfamily hydrolase
MTTTADTARDIGAHRAHAALFLARAALDPATYLHALRVYLGVLKIDASEEPWWLAAILHDVVEDSDATLEDIEVFFGPEVRRLVEALTHAPGESYAAYIQRIVAAGKAAILVKLEDVHDNLERPDKGDGRDEARKLKYRAALKALRAGLVAS